MSSLTFWIFFRALVWRKLQPPQPRSIPAFSFDGQRRRSTYSEAGCLHLEEGGWATLKRNRRGLILAVIFRNHYGADAMRRTLQAGQRYSFEEHVVESFVWQHRAAILANERADFERSTLDVVSADSSQGSCTL